MPHMGIPAVMAAHRRDAGSAPAAPTGPIGEAVLHRLAQGPQVGDIHQQAMAALLQDLARPAIVGGDHRQAAGAGLQQGEPKGFGERRVDEYPAQAGGPAVDRRYLMAQVLLGIGHRSVEIKAIHQLKQLLEHLPLGALQLAGVLATAQQ